MDAIDRTSRRINATLGGMEKMAQGRDKDDLLCRQIPLMRAVLAAINEGATSTLGQWSRVADCISHFVRDERSRNPSDWERFVVEMATYLNSCR